MGAGDQSGAGGDAETERLRLQLDHERQTADRQEARLDRLAQLAADLSREEIGAAKHRVRVIGTVIVLGFALVALVLILVAPEFADKDTGLNVSLSVVASVTTAGLAAFSGATLLAVYRKNMQLRAAMEELESENEKLRDELQRLTTPQLPGAGMSSPDDP